MGTASKSARRPTAFWPSPAVSDATMPYLPMPVSTSSPHCRSSPAINWAVFSSCIDSSGLRCRCSNHSSICARLACIACELSFIVSLLLKRRPCPLPASSENNVHNERGGGRGQRRRGLEPALVHQVQVRAPGEAVGIRRVGDQTQRPRGRGQRRDGLVQRAGAELLVHDVRQPVAEAAR